MKILYRYLSSLLLRNLFLSLIAFTALFLVFDFFDHIDNILPEDAALWMIVEYFLLKIPSIVSLMLPVSMLVATLFTIGMLSKHSEITAMRASGLTVFWIARPLFVFGIVFSLIAILLNETLVPYSAQKSNEIYAFDIKKRQEKGTYNQSNLGWRNGNSFFSVGMFDSRNNSLNDLIRFDLTDTFDPIRRINADSADYLIKNLGWTMHNVTEFRFFQNGATETHSNTPLPLNISSVPSDFYDLKADPSLMSFRQLRSFIRTQTANGVSTQSYLPDLYEKFSSPFLVLIVIPVVLPFALKPARSGSLAVSFFAALIIGFSYYVVHSLSLALGRGEIWPPLLAAWMANIVMGIVGAILLSGAEAPN